jgi:hypothetical protein
MVGCVAVVVLDPPPPRVARTTPAASATVPPKIASFTHLGDHHAAFFCVFLFPSTIRLTFDIETVDSPDWFP